MRHLLNLLTIFISGLLLAQAPTIDWQKTFGGLADDFGFTVTSDTNGNIIVGGSTSSTNGDVTLSYGGLDIWIIKYDTDGNLMWKKNYGGSGEDYVWDIKASNDGGYIFAGNTSSNDEDVSENYGASDFWIVKLDADGNIQWEKSIGGSDFDDISKIVETESGDFILIGSSTSNDGPFTNNSGNIDIAVAKISSTGNLLWSHLFGGNGYDFGIDGFIDNNDTLVVSAFGDSTNGIFNSPWSGSNVIIFSLEINSGLIIWHQIIAGNGSDQTYSLIQLENGHYLAGINSNSTDGDFTNNFGASDIWLFEFLPGEIFNKYHYGGSYSEAPMALHQTTSGNIIVAARSASTDGHVSNNHGNSDFWVFNISPNGNIIWENSYGGSNLDDVWDMAVLNDGIALVGNTKSNDGDVSGNHGESDFWILKLNADEMGLNENHHKTISVYPNPFSDKIYIDSQENLSSIEITDLTGKIVSKEKFHFKNKQLNTSGLTKGVYILKIKTTTGKSFTQKIVKR